MGSRPPSAAPIVAILIGLVGLLAAEALEASCQSYFCRYRMSLGQRDREAELMRRVLDDPADADAVLLLRHTLSGKVYREREIADYERRYRWEPSAPPPDPEEAVARQRRWLDEIVVRSEGDDPAAACRRARNLAGAEERLAAVRDLLAERPGEPVLAVCLAEELAAQERREEAIASLHTYLDQRPEHGVYDALIHLHGRENAAATGPLLEERAARLPDSVQAQVWRLRHLDRYRASTEEAARADALAERLLVRPMTLSERSDVCGALGDRLPERRRECLLQLRREALDEEGQDAEASRTYRRMAENGLVFQAIRSRDERRLEEALALVPAGDRSRLWGQAVDHSRGELCPPFLAAFPGLPRAGAEPAMTLVRALRTCGEEALAARTLEESGLEREDGSDPTRTTSVADLRRYAPRPASRALPPRTLRAAVERASPGFRRDLEAWAREEPESIVPWLYLAALHEHRGRADQAVTSFEAATAVRPDDLDLAVALGATALRLGRPDVVRSVARRLETAARATARHRAEAAFLTGRLAMRDGRSEEAADRLAEYFLRRIRFEGCRMTMQCDHALVLHLVETGDRNRLDRYLEARATAFAAFVTSTGPIPQRNRCHTAPFCPGYGDVEPALLELECASPRAVERLAARLAEEPGDDERARRLADLRSRRPCSAEELPDPDAVFADDELLALSWILLEIR